MLQAKLNGKTTTVSFDESLPVVDGHLVAWDIERISETRFHIIYKNKSFLAELVQHDRASKMVTLKINGAIHKVEIKDRYDLLLEKMGMSSSDSGKVLSVKAPMPGLIVKLMVGVGDTVKSGDALLVLEAMKMENMIKATSDAIVSQIKIKKGDSVERGQALIEFHC